MRLLITKYDGMGDIILFEPALRMLLERVGNLEIAVLIREVNAGLTALIDLPIQWITTNLNPYGEIAENWDDVELVRLADEIKAFQPHEFLSGIRTRTWLDMWVAYTAGAERNHGFAQGCMAPEVENFLNQRWGGTAMPGWNGKSVSTDQPEYLANADLVGSVYGFAPTDVSAPKLNVKGEAREAAKHLLETMGLARGEFVLYAPFGILNNPRKAWSPGKHRTMIEHLRGKHGWAVLATGAIGEKQALDSFCAGFEEPPQTWLGQREELPLYAALIEASRCYIGNDTGPMHIAAALGIPVFAVFGGGHGRRFHPVGSQVAVVTRPMACFGCEWDCAWPEAACLTGLPSEIVVGFLEEWLKAGMTSRSFQWRDQGEEVQSIIRLLAENHRTHRVETERYERERRELEGWLKSVEKARGELEEWLKISEEDRAARLRMLKSTEEQLAQCLNSLDQERRKSSELQQAVLRLRQQMKVLEESHALALDLLESVPRQFPRDPQRLLPVRQSLSLRANQAPLRLHFDLFNQNRDELRISGWVLSKSLEPIANLRLVVKAAGVEWLTPIDLEVREDVLENLQILDRTLPCAFDVVIDTGELPIGQHGLFLGGRTTKGKTIRHRINRSLFIER